MAHDTHGFTLTVHPASGPGAVRSLGGGIIRNPTQLHVCYGLEGDLGRLRIPPTAAPRAADELWRHTCFELFLAAPGEPGYFEFNFSPSGEWAVYRFSTYRERVPFDAQAAAPQITVGRNAAGGFTLDAVIPCAALPPGCSGALRLAISAVIESADGALAYWALKHPAGKPDFHHPDAFVLELDEIRN